MAKKEHPILDKVKEFFHRLTTKISLTFKGRNAVFVISVDLTQPVIGQLKGIEHTLLQELPSSNELAFYLQTVKNQA